MFSLFSNKQKIKQSVNHFDSLIAKCMTVEGAINFSGSLKIAGKVNGNVIGGSDDEHKSSTVLIDKSSVISGDIIADSVIIHGTVYGNITASSVYIAGSAQILHPISVKYKILQIQPGVNLNDVKFSQIYEEKVEVQT